MTLRLEGLDGYNPLAFMAACGLVRVLDEASLAPARLAWLPEGRAVATLEIEAAPEQIVAAVMTHRDSWRGCPELAIAYEKGGKTIRDLKPPPAQFRQFTLAALATARPGAYRHADFTAGFGSPAATDNTGQTKPTAFHFTAGQQKFVEMVLGLVEGLQAEHVEEALFGPWRYEATLPVLRWDVRGERMHALLGYDPARESPTGVPGADWLAFQSLPLFPTFPYQPPSGRVRLQTTGFHRTEGSDHFVWPLWMPPVELSTLRSLLALRGLTELTAVKREAMGVWAVLEARVRRSEQGGYGSFGAPRVLPPGRPRRRADREEVASQPT